MRNPRNGQLASGIHQLLQCVAGAPVGLIDRVHRPPSMLRLHRESVLTALSARITWLISSFLRAWMSKNAQRV
jgi:hypothetical protein